MNISLSAGHSKTDPGAVNPVTGVTEYMFNYELSVLVQMKLEEMGNKVTLVHRGNLNELPNQINKTNSDVHVELHCNAFNSHATGTECLYYTGSKNGRRLGQSIQEEMVKVLRLSDRGVKESTRELILRKTKMPCVIVESGFIDNIEDLKVLMLNKVALAKAIAVGIHNYGLN
ncbi:MAG: N-acetylmuramoyl-L-alanine amidase [Fusobacteriaceae bacterium]